MTTSILEKVEAIINAEPHSSQALLLFGLIKTLDIEKGGHMYLLIKLKEMSEEARQIAYQLMELMASENIKNVNWQQFVEKIEETIRSA